MTARMLALDLRRGPAPLVALVVLALGGMAALSAPDECQGAWNEAVLALRDSMWLVLPCVLAAGIWHGGRARRRGLDDAVAAAALPPARRAAVEGASLGLAVLAVFVVLLVAVTAGGCTSGALGASAAASALVTLVSLVAAAFVGLALGRTASSPMAAPLALFLVLAVTSVFGGWSPGDGRVMLILPGLGEDVTVADLTVRRSLGQLLWFAGLAVSGWLWASGRRLAGLAPAAAGAAALAALSS